MEFPIAPDDPITATFLIMLYIYGQLKIKEELEIRLSPYL
jgi:hypothetical protein